MNVILESLGRISPGALRSAGAVLVSIAALQFPSQAAQVTLSGTTGNTCTYSSYTTNVPNFDYTFTCTGTAASPGQIAFNPTVYAGNINQTGIQVGVVRNSGTTGAVGATVSSGAGCTVASGSPVSFADMQSATQYVSVTAGPSATTCTLSLSAATGGASLGGSATVNVTDPNQPGTFAFAVPSSSVSTGVTTHSVTVNRVGGSFGPYTVAFSEALAGVTGYSTTTSTPLSWSGGDNAPKTILVGNTGTTAGTVTYTLGAVTPSTTTASGTHMVTVSAATSGSCPAPGNGVTTLNQLAYSGSTVLVSGPTGAVFTMPVSPTATKMRVFGSSNTPTSGWGASFGVSTCPGVIFADWPQGGHVTDPVAGHLGGCRKTASSNGNALDVTTASDWRLPCWIAPAERLPAWYLTVRVDGCSLSTCEFYIAVD